MDFGLFTLSTNVVAAVIVLVGVIGIALALFSNDY